jgi:hypothetical protein
MPDGLSMSTLTIRVPDDKHERLKALARSHSISINKLMDELAKIALPNHDARVRIATRAASGNPKRALSLFETMDRAGRALSRLHGNPSAALPDRSPLQRP